MTIRRGGSASWYTDEPLYVPPVTITGTTHTLLLANAWAHHHCTNAAGCTITIASGGTAEPGTRWTFMGTGGPLTFVASGVTFNYPTGLVTPRVNSLVTVVKFSATVYDIIIEPDSTRAYPRTNAAGAPSMLWWVPQNSDLPANATSAPTQSQVRARRIYVPRTISVDRWAISVTTLGNAACTARAGLYLPDADGSYIGALYAEFSQRITTGLDTTGIKETATFATPLVVTPGAYWLAVVIQDNATVPTVQACGPRAEQLPATSSADALSTSPNTCYILSGVTGALPNPWGGNSTSKANTPPVVALRVA